ncbi:MAG: SDR family NAD(P)-dependent oxidoreductase [Nostoc sp.]|uniref:SDR family NAD(P)-dependent oxidoreductase n=1 Tax=Nostoc sp. TaxID=1180 RepID=UPI002FFAF64E
MVQQSHFELWPILKNHILSIFNAPNFKEQPRVLVELGCGNGLLLQQIYLWIRDHSLRGNVLDEHDLTLVGIEQCPDLIQTATRNLGDIPADVISMPLNCPEQILRELDGRITAKKQDILFVQSVCHLNDEESDLSDIRDITEYNRQMLSEWSNVVGRHGLLICQSHPVLLQLTKDINYLSHDFNNLPNEAVPKTSDIGAESFLILAANVGLFPASQLTPTDTSVVHFQKVDYRIRHTRSSDLPALVQLEKECWSIELQATSTNLVDRLNNYPEGQLVLELPDYDNNYKVVGAIYSQRIESADQIQTITANRVSELHSQNGSIVQLLAVNILPKVQERRLGDHLLEFMLQRCSAIDGIESIVAVTLCKEFHRHEFSFEEYIRQRNVRGKLIDPILRFHELHGANIEWIVENYRPLDRNNQGHGVLVRYPIHQRRRDDRRINDAAKWDAEPQAWDTELATAFLEATVQSCLGDEKRSGYKFDRPLMEMGLNSVDLLILSEQISARFGLILDPAFFFSYTTPEKVLMFLIEKQKLSVTQNEKAGGKGAGSRGEKPSPSLVDGVSTKSEREQGSVHPQGVRFVPPVPSSPCPLPPASYQNVASPFVAPTDTLLTTTPKSAISWRTEATDSDDAVAIVGLACRLPGGINNPESLWDLLKNGGSVIEKLPEGRWQWPRDIDPEGKHQGIDWGGFLSQIDLFDAGFFRISAIEAQSMDPQQRILMELAWQTLENAGITANKVAGSSTGVFVGASGSDYCRVMEQVGIPIEAHVATGTSLAALANRISYFFDLRGPSIVIDTACSSSLMAVHQAVQCIRSGECLQALVGGIHIMSHPANSIAYYKAGMLAHDGKCKTFDDRADGYVRSEGAVMFLLKQLHQAKADGDLIYATIKGSASNHGGQSAGLTVPNPQQQAALLTNAWKASGVAPNTISFIEAHGTGTALGDPIEIQGIQQAFSEWSETPQVPISCGLGSLKTNLGHLEAAAGIAGLLKVVLCLQHQELPANQHFGHLNRHINLADSPFYIVDRHQKWDRPNESIPRRAGVSSFGSGGANAHVVVEEYDVGCSVELGTGDWGLGIGDWEDKSVDSDPSQILFAQRSHEKKFLAESPVKSTQSPSGQDSPTSLAEVGESWALPAEKVDDRTSEPFLFVLSAQNTAQLRDYVKQFEQWLSSLSDEQCSLAELTRFLQSHRQAFEERLAVVAASRVDLVNKLRQFPDIGESGFQGNIKHPSREVKTLIRGTLGEQVIQAAIAGRDWEQLAALWVAGVSLDWCLLNGNQLLTASSKHWRFSMPTYPFAKNRFWLPGTTSLQESALPDANASVKPEQSASEAELFTLKLVWQPVDISSCEKSGSKMPDGKTVIIGGTPEQKEVLQTYFTQCEFMAIATDADIHDLVEQLKLLGRIAHIIWVGGSNSARNDFPENLLVNQASDLVQVYRLLKAAAVIYGNEGLQWTAIALQSQAVFCGEDPDPTQAGIHGFIGSIAKEFPQWKFRLLDMPSPAGTSYIWPVPEMFVPFDSDVRSLAWRDGKWYRPILAKLFLSEPGRSAYRAGGVYVVIGGAGGLGEVWSRYLSEKYRAQIVWIGRSPLNDTIQQKLEAIANLGPMPRYISADATSQEELQRAYEQIKHEFGSVQGVVHAAVGLFDRSFNDTDEARLRTVLSAKVDVSVRLAQVFHTEDLDFVLFFSSIEALSQSGGLSGYAAGCAFKDAFSQCLASRWNCPVKVIHWGHWAIGTGDRISQASKTRLKQRGIGLLESKESMQALECLVSNNRLNQLALIKSASVEAIDWYDGGEFVVSFEEVTPSIIHEIRHIDVAPNQSIGQLQADGIFQCKQMQPLLIRLLQTSLNTLNLHSSGSVPDFYAKWLAASRSILTQNETGARLESPNIVWQAWKEARDNWPEADSKQRAFSLVETCVRALPEILSGQKRGTDSLFPNGSLQIVEGIYRDNSVADYFNEVLAKSLRSAIEARLRHDPRTKLRILEIGAGTGATTKAVLSKLAGLEDSISEYRYTDISRAFLLHAQEKFIPDHPFVEIGIFDVEQPLAGQKIAGGTYDFAITTNVLHATRNIRQTLRNVKACLRTNGLILLNELCDQTLFGHLTFGLLEGWWRHEDPELRIDGTPLLSVESWERVLQTEGFQSPWFPAAIARSLGQQAIVAESDGLVRQNRPSVGNATRTVESGSGISSIDAINESDDTSLRQKATRFFQQLVAKILRMDPEQIEADEPFQSYGIDSILIVQIAGALQEKFGGIHSTLLFEVQTLGELVNYFTEYRRSDLIAQLSNNRESAATLDQNAASESPDAEPAAVIFATNTSRLAARSRSNTTDAIAIIGMSGRYPMANDLSTFWERLKAGTDCISEIPRDRWSWEDHFHPHVEEAVELGKSYCKWGSFLDDAKEFDAQFFGISPHEVVNIDPQERIFLQAAWEALEDAGHTRQMLESKYQQQVGVFVGVTRTGFDLYGPELWRQGKIGHPHTSFSSIANRLSYFLNLRGPSMPIDTMCSSSLTAVHEACQHLQNGSVQLAFAGGVNLYLHPSSYNILCASKMLSKDGRCKSFGNYGNGFVPGEGVGVVLLKPLSVAIADRDNIYAVIRGTHVNHGGKTNGYTVPNPKAQAELVFEALEKSGVDAREVSYIEAHGTGTELGDPIEVAGLTKAFQLHTQDTSFCAIGSVKSNVGHLEAASGIAGLTKAILQLRHKQLVPSLHADELNPNIDFPQTPFYVQRHLQHWPQPIVEVDGKTKTVPRIAGVSSFGAGGVNAHVVVEEYDEEPTSESEIGDTPVLMLLSARNNGCLAAYANKLHQFLEAGAVNLQNLAYTLQVGREALQSRIAMLVYSQSDAIAKLDAFIKGKSDIDDCYVGLAGKDKATVLKWNSDPDLLKQITAWTEEGCYARLAELWVKGVNIDWSRLRRTSTISPRRISLPTYSFERKRYWLELEGNNSSQITPTVNTQATSGEQSSKAIELNDQQQTIDSPKSRKLITLVDTDKVQCDKVNRRNRQPIRLSDPADLTPQTKVTSSFLSLSPQGEGIVEIRIAAADRPLDASRLSTELRDKMRSLALRDEVRVLLLVDDGGLFSGSITHNDVPVMRALIGFLLELELPLIVLLKSDIRGLGWNLASLCDFLIFRESGQFCHRGLSDRDRSIIEERFGKSFASRFFALPHLCSGQALVEMGLDCLVAADDRLDDLACDFATQISHSPQRSLIELKKQLSRSVQSLVRHAYFPSPANSNIELSDVSAVPFFTHQDLKRMVEENDQWLASPTLVATYCDVVHVHTFGNGVVQVTLADTANKNMFSNAFSEGLTQAFEHIESVPTYKVVVLIGYNQYFACGGTKSGLQDIYNGRARFTDNDIHSLPLRCHLPAIAAMQGHAIGGGWSLGMFCDVNIFSEESIYQTPYMQYGFTPGAGSTLIFPARLGPNLSREILFGGREYKGAELKERGISMPVLPRSQVLGYALKLAHHLAKFSQNELVQRKNQATAGLKDLLDAVHTQELAMHEKTFVGQSQVLKNIHERFDRGIELGIGDRGLGTGDWEDKSGDSDQNQLVIQTLRETIAAELFLETEEIDEDAKFVDLGLDSISAVMWIKRINVKFDLSLPATKVYSYPTLREFANYVQQSSNVLNGLKNRQGSREQGAGEKVQMGIRPHLNENHLTEVGDSDPCSAPLHRSWLGSFPPAPCPLPRASSLKEQTATPEATIVGDRVENCPPAPMPLNRELPSSPSILNILTESLAEELFMEATEIDEEAKFVDMGMDSITAVTWIRKINQLFGSSLPATDVYKYPTLSDFARNIEQTVARMQSNNAVALSPQTASAHQKSAELKVLSAELEMRKNISLLQSPSFKDEVRLDTQHGLNAPILLSTTEIPEESLPTPVDRNYYSSDAIAIIGMAGRFPQAKNLAEFWENIANGKNCVSEIASDRWNLADFYDPDRNAANKTYCKSMGALEDIDQFDPLFFHISPREAEFMDPQQRLFLQTSWQCIEDAGYNPTSFAGSKCGVFVGCETGDYGKIVQRYELNALGLLGSSAALLPARISYFLNLQGPCMAIDTACSASLVAIANACDSLLLGHSDAALAGGVYVLSGPEMHIMMSKAGILSPDGRCFTFDRRANGFVPGEGVGVMLLKRLADAEKDGDDICGVIRGWGVNQDGKTNGITAPNGQSQQRLQKQVYERFQIQPADIQLVEAHGTGTRLGDPIEVEALCETFREFTNKEKFCAIGSLKSNIGHLATAAGVAGVIKVLLAIRNKKLPPTINYESLNEHINLDSSPFYINTKCTDWIVDAEPRRAAINCFGFSGTNAHMVIEEYVNRSDRHPAITDVAPAQPYPILLSAKNEQRLWEYAEQLLKHLESQTQPGEQPTALRYRLCDLAYTLQVGREPMDARLGFVADTLTEVRQKLRRFLDRSLSTQMKSFDSIYCGLVGSDSSDFIKFAADSDIVTTTNSWLSQRKYSKVMELWVRGVAIDWTQIYTTGVTAPKRIRLPTYPFARERYWIGKEMGAIADLSVKKSEFADRLDSASQLGDFQEINYPSCGVGILPALNMGRVRTPIPQENLGCFFTCQSLEWTPEALPEDIPWSDRFADYQDQKILIVYASDRDKEGICSLLRKIEASVGLERSLNLQCLSFDALTTIPIGQPLNVVLAVESKDDTARNYFEILGEWLKSQQGLFDTYYLTANTEGFADIENDPATGAIATSLSNNCRIISVQQGTSCAEKYQVLLREWLSRNPLDERSRLEWVRYDGVERFVLHRAKYQPVESGEKSKRLYSIQKKWKQGAVRPTETSSFQGEMLILVNEETSDLGQRLFSQQRAVILYCANNDSDRNRQISAQILDFRDSSCGLESAKTILSQLERIRIVVDLSALYQSSKDCDRDALGKIAFYQQLIAVSSDLDILYVTKGLQHFRSDTISLAGAKLAGLIKVLSAEHAYVTSRHIDIDTAMLRNPGLLEQALTQELTANLEETEICYRQQERFVPYLEAELEKGTGDWGLGTGDWENLEGDSDLNQVLFAQGLVEKKTLPSPHSPLFPEATPPSPAKSPGAPFLPDFGASCRGGMAGHVEEPRADFSIRSDGVYVISGGTGGIGLEIADYLVAKGARKLVLMGLNPLPPKTKWGDEGEQYSEHLKVKLGKLASLDRQVEHLSIYTGSLTESHQLADFFAEIRDRVGSIGGVIHSAGITSDFKKPAFVTKDLAGIAAVLEPKVAGLEALAAVFANDILDFFVAFSSLTGLIPRFAKGSCDYALANAYVDWFMAYQNTQLHKRGYKSITWVDWHETGMAARAPSCIFKAMQNNLDKIGLFTHSNEVGKDLFELALQQRGAAWVLNTELDPTKFGEAAPTLLFARDRSASNSQTEVSSIQHQIEQWESLVQKQGFIAPECVTNIISLSEIKRLEPQLIHRIYRLLFPQTAAKAFDKESHEAIAFNANDSQPNQPDALAIDVIREVATQVLKLKEIDDNRKFQDYGLDSISATQLAIRLEKRLQQEVPPQWLLDFPTVKLLTDCLQRQPVPLAIDGELIAKAIEKAVREVLKIGSIDYNQTFQNYGLDSISATQLAIKLEKHLEQEILPQWLIDYPTITLLARHLITQR